MKKCEQMVEFGKKCLVVLNIGMGLQVCIALKPSYWSSKPRF
jgi:hypothetical protein